MPVVQDFERELQRRLAQAQESGNPYVDVNSGELHRDVGGYPGRDHRMPICCGAMMSSMKFGDEVLARPPKGRGASLTIRYKLPR
jgi:hypothetical protein